MYCGLYRIRFGVEGEDGSESSDLSGLARKIADKFHVLAKADQGSDAAITIAALARDHARLERKFEEVSRYADGMGLRTMSEDFIVEDVERVFHLFQDG